MRSVGARPSARPSCGRTHESTLTQDKLPLKAQLGITGLAQAVSSGKSQSPSALTGRSWPGALHPYGNPFPGDNQLTFPSSKGIE
jgi:hypothetical protein